MLCKWDVDTDDGGRENWLPVRLGKCSESNTWDVFWLTKKDNALVFELIDGGPSMSKGVVESDLRPMDERKNTLLKPKGVVDLRVGRTY